MGTADLRRPVKGYGFGCKSVIGCVVLGDGLQEGAVGARAVLVSKLVSGHGLVLEAAVAGFKWAVRACLKRGLDLRIKQNLDIYRYDMNSKSIITLFSLFATVRGT